MGSSDKPEDLDAAFDEIVADWRQDGSAPVWPLARALATGADSVTHSATWRVVVTGWLTVYG